jgi:hypothetical protein
LEETDCGERSAIGDDMVGIASRVGSRQRNTFKSNIKAIKSGIKSATSWIPNIFTRNNSLNANRNCNFSAVNNNNNRLTGISKGLQFSDNNQIFFIHRQ